VIEYFLRASGVGSERRDCQSCKNFVHRHAPSFRKAPPARTPLARAGHSTVGGARNRHRPKNPRKPGKYAATDPDNDGSGGATGSW
jgi:hypothetical protein